LDRTEADAARLVRLTRAHWSIENGLHYTRDETLGEDRCRVRRGAAPQVLAALRNVAVHVLRTRKASSAAAAARQLAACPLRALDLLKDPESISE
jgi:predicted transposase YbfD/YdcC